MSKCLLLLLLLLVARSTLGFLSFNRVSNIASSLSLSSSNDDWNDKDYQDALARNRLRTDARIFLTQRALQGFIGILHDCRDPHTVKWMERSFNFSNLESYHGTGALNMTTWDGIIHDLMHLPPQIVIVAAKRRGRGHGGWSKDNPYLQDRFVEFEIDIEPVSLATRLLSVRSHIAKEWVQDLATLVKANEMILDDYHQRTARQRQQDNSKIKATVAATVTSSNSTENLENFLRSHRDDDRDVTAAKLDNRAYTRHAQLLLENHIGAQDLAPSPHRRGNFDLLVLLATQEAIHRVLREYRATDRLVSKAWLRQFYIDRVATHFDGQQRHGRADDFLEELLQTSPSMSQNGEYVEFVDPLRMTEEILAMRSVVSLEWQAIMKNVPEEQMELQRAVLMLRMNPKPVAEAEPAVVQVNETGAVAATVGTIWDEQGGFE